MQGRKRGPQITKKAFTQFVAAGRYRIIHAGPTSTVIQPSCVLQIGKMPGNGRLGELQDRHYFADAEFTFQQEAEDAETGLV
jgi:hypothetical protein